MKLLYGLTEKQMWEVARQCEFENWKYDVETALENDFDYDEIDENKIITATECAIEMWGKADCHNDYVKADIIQTSIMRTFDEE